MCVCSLSLKLLLMLCYCVAAITADLAYAALMGVVTSPCYVLVMATGSQLDALREWPFVAPVATGP